jgi:hypothetical protein
LTIYNSKTWLNTKSMNKAKQQNTNKK